MLINQMKVQHYLTANCVTFSIEGFSEFTIESQRTWVRPPVRTKNLNDSIDKL